MNNYKIYQILEPNYGFPNLKNSINLLILQIVKFWKFGNFPNCEIVEICYFEIVKLQKFPIYKI